MNIITGIIITEDSTNIGYCMSSAKVGLFGFQNNGHLKSQNLRSLMVLLYSCLASNGVAWHGQFLVIVSCNMLKVMVNFMVCRSPEAEFQISIEVNRTLIR